MVTNNIRRKNFLDLPKVYVPHGMTAEVYMTFGSHDHWYSLTKAKEAGYIDFCTGSLSCYGQEFGLEVTIKSSKAKILIIKK